MNLSWIVVMARFTYKGQLEGKTSEEGMRVLVEKADEDLRSEVNTTYELLMNFYREVYSVFWFAFHRF